MKNRIFLLSLILLVGCASHSALMSKADFDDVQVGTNVSSVTEKIGQPYAIHNGSGGSKEYEYVERITTGNTLIYENHYFITVKDGMITGKSVSQEQVKAFDLIYQDDPNHNQYP